MIYTYIFLVPRASKLGDKEKKGIEIVQIVLGVTVTDLSEKL